MPYASPEFRKSAFNCPHCNAYASQDWEALTKYSTSKFVEDAFTSACSHCSKYTIWVNNKMIYPLVDGVPNPHIDMPEDIKGDYEEARSIVSRSPRSAAALLRFSIENLTKNLLDKEAGKDLNDNIKKLVSKGLPDKIQKALDFLRVIGNNAVHPSGLIDLKDNRQTATSLFELLNMIVDVMISQPKKIDSLYDSLPEKDKSNIKKRDNKTAV